MMDHFENVTRAHTMSQGRLARRYVADEDLALFSLMRRATSNVEIPFCGLALPSLHARRYCFSRSTRPL
jgi:hypothetical protein